MAGVGSVTTILLAEDEEDLAVEESMMARWARECQAAVEERHLEEVVMLQAKHRQVLSVAEG